MRRRKGAWLAASLAVAVALPVLANTMTTEAFNPESTVATFRVGMRLPLRVEGRFKRADGELVTMANGHLRVHARLDGRHLDMKGPDWLRKVTLSKDFLDVRRHPDIRFDSSEFDAGLMLTGGPLHGRLQLRGQVREVEFTLLPAGCARPGHDCDIQVRGGLNRRDFGMHAYRFSVRDDISFDFSIRLAGTMP